MKIILSYMLIMVLFFNQQYYAVNGEPLSQTGQQRYYHYNNIGSDTDRYANSKPEPEPVRILLGQPGQSERPVRAVSAGHDRQ